MKKVEKIEILKKAMSEKYCGETRFDFLDKEEIPMILKAMKKFSDHQQSMVNDNRKANKQTLLSFLEYIEDRLGYTSDLFHKFRYKINKEEKLKIVSKFME